MAPATTTETRYAYNAAGALAAEYGPAEMESDAEYFMADRLGSVVMKGSQRYHYYPYDQEIGGATTNDTPKFGTYTRDVSGLDYAMNRFYKNEWGRFTSPDPYQVSGGVADPRSWNRYSYAQGDPVNFNDPSGLFISSGGICVGARVDGTCIWSFRDAYMPILPNPEGGGGGGGGACLDPSYLPFFPLECMPPPALLVPVIADPSEEIDPIEPAYLMVDSDCYSVTGVMERRVTYSLHSVRNQRLYGFTITEHLEGDLPVTGSTQRGLPDSTFEDRHSVLLGKEVQALTQTFTASHTRLGYQSAPVFVRGFKNKLGIAQDYGTLAIYKTKQYIKINDDYGGTFDKNGAFKPNKICD